MVFHKYLADSKMFEYDRYYRECQQQNKPFIKAKINPVHGNYLIQVDLITCNYELSKQKQERIKKLIQVEIDHIKSNHEYDFAGYSITSCLAWFDGVSSEHVDNICNTLYGLICTYRN